VVSLSEVDPETLPGRELTPDEKKIAGVLSPIVPDGRVYAPSETPGAVAAFVWKDKWVLASVTVEHSKVARKKLKDQARREAEMQRDQEERQRQHEAEEAAEQAALEDKAKSGGFPDVETMLAAEAKAAAELAEAERQRKIAAEEVRQKERRAQEQAEATQIAEEARKRKAEKDAAVAAAHQAFLAEQEATRQARLAEQEARKAKRCKGSPPRPTGGKAVGKR
jgi:hypothetical protein